MNNKLLGIVLLVVGVVLLIIGMNSSDSFVDQASEAFTGRYTDKTMWYMIGGGAMALLGAVLAFLGFSNKKAA